ncbi:glycoside hydrolase family 18 protein [Cristinia sonorae]|uniref:Glycoside hydrolase family 18 protein n=1 Tax=Cristinia sonorae TaxID=1940300 RepID=A0A8K0ULC9_9AGAR|nr:glycoside hydrolase family 18 protein [Cristinia sonorae]
MDAKVAITKHTTASDPRPHVVYHLQVTSAYGTKTQLTKRYSDFVELHTELNDPFTLPPKRILATTFLPSAWVDDTLIAERKAGLSAYINALLTSPSFKSSPVLAAFLEASSNATSFSLEDALPSTLSRAAAQKLLAKGGEVKATANPVAAAYYPDWSAGSNPPENLDYSKFDILFFAFAIPNSSNGISWDDGGTAILQRLVKSARNSGKGTKIVLSIGGWGGSYWFSQVMSSSGNRSAFVNAAVNAVNTYGLDGIDIDWEYPNQSGAGNPHSANDSANLLSFFTSLRSALGSSKIISAAVTCLPFTGSNGSPLTNVSAYAAQMTYANIMNYDTWGASSNPGPNAPLGNLCGTSRQPQASAQAALAQWTAAGFPASKLLLGLPLYGYVSKSTARTLTGIALPPAGFDLAAYKERVMNLPVRNPNFACALPVKGDEELGEPVFLDGNHERVKEAKKVPEVEAKAAGDLSSYFGQQIAFNQIVALGALKKSGSVYVEANGFTQAWDDCSDTPFLFNTSRQTVVTYDDTYSLGDKAAFARQNGMAGCFTWSLDQDDGYALQNVIRSNLGK